MNMHHFRSHPVREVVLRGEVDTFTQIRGLVTEQVREAGRSELQALVIDEIRRLHGRRPSEWEVWKKSQNQMKPPSTTQQITDLNYFV